MEDYMAVYYLHDIKKVGDDIDIRMKTTVDKNAIGITANQNIVSLIKSYTKYNEDSLSILISKFTSNSQVNKVYIKFTGKYYFMLYKNLVLGRQLPQDR